MLFSANDAYMRDFRIIVPSDCTASEDVEQNRQILLLMQRVLKAQVWPSTQLEFENTKVISSTFSTVSPRDATIR